MIDFNQNMIINDSIQNQSKDLLFLKAMIVLLIN